MATHNQVRAVGFLLDDPKIIGEGTVNEQAILQIRTVHRDNVDNYHGPKYQTLLIYYDGTDLMDKIKNLVKYDVIDVKGVFNIMPFTKRKTCPDCGHVEENINGTQTFIYPINIIKLNSLWASYEHSEDLPERILLNHYEEVSNQVLIIGTVVNEPEMQMVKNNPCCKYRLGVDRKYYIKTQSELKADYPWVYSYGQQAEQDNTHLRQGALVLVDCFMRKRTIRTAITCPNCNTEFTYKDYMTEFIPYSVEYLTGHLTDADLALLGNEKKNKEILNAEKDIFS